MPSKSKKQQAIDLFKRTLVAFLALDLFLVSAALITIYVVIVVGRGAGGRGWNFLVKWAPIVFTEISIKLRRVCEAIHNKFTN